MWVKVVVVRLFFILFKDLNRLSHRNQTIWRDSTQHLTQQRESSLQPAQWKEKTWKTRRWLLLTLHESHFSDFCEKLSDFSFFHLNIIAHINTLLVNEFKNGFSCTCFVFFWWVNSITQFFFSNKQESSVLNQKLQEKKREASRYFFYVFIMFDFSSFCVLLLCSTAEP